MMISTQKSGIPCKTKYHQSLPELCDLGAKLNQRHLATVIRHIVVSFSISQFETLQGKPSLLPKCLPCIGDYLACRLVKAQSTFCFQTRL